MVKTTPKDNRVLCDWILTMTYLKVHNTLSKQPYIKKSCIFKKVSHMVLLLIMDYRLHNLIPKKNHEISNIFLSMNNVNSNQI